MRCQSFFLSLFKVSTVTILASFSLCTAQAKGGGALSIGIHNPHHAMIGGNFLFVWDKVGLEIGLGSLDSINAEQTKGVVLGGDVDFKYYLGSTWRPYVEAGLGYSFHLSVGSGGGLGLNASYPFLGAGIAYFGSPFLLYGGCDYSFSGKKFIPFAGIGVRF